MSASASMPLAILCGCSKFVRAIAAFVAFEVCRKISIVYLIVLVSLGPAVIFTLIHRPLTRGNVLLKKEGIKYLYCGFFRFVNIALWCYAIQLCGPLRATVLYEHSDAIFLAAISALCNSPGTSPTKLRGAVCFLGSFLSFLLLDHDGNISATSGQNTSVFSMVYGSFGFSDHTFGLLLLAANIVIGTFSSHMERRLAISGGGSKHVNAMVSCAAACISIPFFILSLFFGNQLPSTDDFIATALPVLFIILSFVGCYYADTSVLAKLPASTACRVGSLVALATSIVAAAVWPTGSHRVSTGAIIGSVLAAVGAVLLTNVQRATRWDLIGTRDDGLPIYRESALKSATPGFSIMALIRSACKQATESADSRRIFYFLCFNLGFAFVELIYGAWTNSLGLISDGFHMFFDCAALAVGLVAAVVSHWRPTRQFTFGYDRIEVLSGFVNGLFLVVIGIAILVSAIDRLIDPPHISTHRLLVVSFGGLLINLFGIFAFHGAISGSGEDDHGHGHSHGGHGHSHAHGHSHNANMEGVFLHVMADTLGSVSVLISSFFVERYGWMMADPICSVVISLLILMSVVPLLKGTSSVLLLRVPNDLQKALGEGLKAVGSVEGVLSYRMEHFWRHSSNTVCGVIHVLVGQNVLEHKVASRVSTIFANIGVTQMAVQVEKDAFFSHMSGLGLVLDHIPAPTYYQNGGESLMPMIQIAS